MGAHKDLVIQVTDILDGLDERVAEHRADLLECGEGPAVVSWHESTGQIQAIGHIKAELAALGLYQIATHAARRKEGDG